MQVTTKVRVTLELMHELAMRGPQGPTSLASIAWKLGVSLSYLEILCRSLRAKGLIVATRGPGGGYSLGRSAERISMADVMTAVDAPTAEEMANEKDSWMSSDLWSSLNQQMLSHLQSINLRQLVAEQRAKGVALEQEAVEQMSATYAFKANLQTIKTQDEMMGSLLDVKA